MSKDTLQKLSRTTRLYGVLLLFVLPGYAKKTNSIRYIPDSPGVFGSPQHLQLMQSHVSLHPFINDFIGETDKHMTHSLQIGYHKSLRQGFGFQIKASWNLITDALKERQGKDFFEEPVGKSADWINLATTFGKRFHSGLFFESGFSVGHAGNKGAHEVQQSFHEAIGISDRFHFAEQPEKTTFGAYTSLGILRTLPIAQKPALKLQVGYQNNLLIQEFFLQSALIYLNHSLPFAVTAKAGYQLNSPLYHKKVSRFRTELGFYIQFKYFRPGFLYVSNILKDDKRGQLYVELLNFQSSL